MVAGCSDPINRQDHLAAEAFRRYVRIESTFAIQVMDSDGSSGSKKDYCTIAK